MCNRFICNDVHALVNREKPRYVHHELSHVKHQLYLEQVGREVTFLELIEAMRKGGMDLPARDDQAFRVLGIVVKQNAGPDGKRDWTSGLNMGVQLSRPV